MGLRRDFAMIWDFLKVRKLWLLSPIIVMLLLLGLLLVWYTFGSLNYLEVFPAAHEAAEARDEGDAPEHLDIEHDGDAQRQQQQRRPGANEHQHAGHDEADAAAERRHQHRGPCRAQPQQRILPGEEQLELAQGEIEHQNIFALTRKT